MSGKASRQKRARQRILTRGVVPSAEQGKGGMTLQEMAAAAAVRNLEELGGVLFRDDNIVFEGKRLVLPAEMSLDQGIAFLIEKQEEETVTATFSRVFKYRPLDVAFCTWTAMLKAFGSVGHRSSTVQTFFGPKKVPPQLIDVPLDSRTTVQVPWGNFTIPFIPDVEFQLDSTRDDEHGVVGYLGAEGPKKWRYAVHGVFELVQRELEERSIYRGKPFDGRENPQFLDLSKHDPSKMVFSEDTAQQMNASLWGAITHRQGLARQGIPFKRAVLLSGGFGVGKSMAINETGRICEEEGVTFILVRPQRDSLRDAMMTARIYQPAVVAFEDVDILADVESDAKRISEVLDLFDGIEAKNADIMLVLSTNHTEKLHKGMLRPGRLDAVVEIGPPDAAGIRKLIEVNVGPYLNGDLDWDRITDSMQDYLPAFVVEAAHRAVRYNLTRGGTGTQLSTEDLVGAGNGLRPQFRLMTNARTDVERPTLDNALAERVRDEVAIGVERMASGFGATLPDLEEFMAERNKA